MEATTEATTVATSKATSGATSGTTSEATSDASTGVVRRCDKRITISSKHQPQKFMVDHLIAPLDSLNVDW